MRVSGDAGMALRSGRDGRSTLTSLKCDRRVRGGFIAVGGVSGPRKLRGGGEGASCTADDSEQPVGCVVDGEGER